MQVRRSIRETAYVFFFFSITRVAVIFRGVGCSCASADLPQVDCCKCVLSRVSTRVSTLTNCSRIVANIRYDRITASIFWVFMRTISTIHASYGCLQHDFPEYVSKLGRTLLKTPLDCCFDVLVRSLQWRSHNLVK